MFGCIAKSHRCFDITTTKNACTVIGIGTLVLTIICFSMEDEWYNTIGLLRYSMDTSLLKTLDTIIQSMEFTSSVCILFAVSYYGTSSFLKELAIMIYLSCQLSSIICFIVAATVLFNRSSYSIYQKWIRINSAVAGGIYVICLLFVLCFVFVACKLYANLRNTRSPNLLVKNVI